MTEELRNLQAKYIAGVDDMEEADARRFLDLLRDNYAAPYRERRITELTRRLADIDRHIRSEQRKADEQAYNVECMRQFRKITERWESLGVERVELHEGNTEAWIYEGERIYEWGTADRPTVTEMLAEVRKIDAGLSFV